MTFKEAFSKVLDIKIGVVYVLLLISAYWIINSFLKKPVEKQKSNYSLKQQKLRSFNKTTDPDRDILYQWAVYFDYDTPFIADLTPFCTKHGAVPIRFINNRCPFQDCKNSRQQIDLYTVKNFIESDLIYKWENIKTY